MLEYAPMLHVSYYAQNYAGIIRQGLHAIHIIKNLPYCDSSNAFSRVDISLTWLVRLKRLIETPGRNKTVLGYHGKDRFTLGMVGSGNKTTGTLAFGVASSTRNSIWA